MSDPLSRLVGELSRLPGIGPKTAGRLAHHLLRVPEAQARELAAAIVEVKEKLFYCSRCNAITAVDPCRFCTDEGRDRTRICVVEEPFNIPPIERTGEFRGLYHVLLGALSPQRGIGPDELAIPQLLARLDGVEEVVLATNPNVEGEATALYLARLLRARVPHLTRLAFGMPVGGDIEFTDEVTLARSLAGRREL
ncbi:MAG TPA: recombination mediator RecR [Thermoanaerobaculia bacterium]|nr:recombination protein RecR [Thermoanaerobaculia bacterium]MDI9631174.1 recombination mediator RecR [Acidobacteriota bacterium]OQC38458.1 MAG: Recombination protein RecR [Acidobacteria bacterium ADurb.Bin051]MBP7812389.1 recombination protein RecR [Thermoanaerobaculia bacterium]MBP8845393.1 recombination protein RecR [Thermoanaerobaculia bacterium]